MPSVKNFDKDNLKQLRLQLQNAVNDVAKNFGIQIDVGNISYSNTEATIKVKAKTKTNDKLKETQALDNVKQWANIHGINILENKGWKLVDYHSRKSKFPYIAVGPDGKRYKLSVTNAQIKMGADISKMNKLIKG